jgi:hypothetical protein
MPNSTEGNKACLLARQTPQASDDRTAEHIAAVASKTEKDSLVKFMAAKSAADAVPAGAPRRWSVPRARPQHAGNSAPALGGADKAKKKTWENWRKKDREVRNFAQGNVRVPIDLKDAFNLKDAFKGPGPGRCCEAPRAGRGWHGRRHPVLADEI